MLARRLYYLLKPHLPWSLRMALRRRVARRLRAGCAGVWPIDPRTAAIPPGWPGWPEGRDFAVVLTHDVESGAGLAKCRRLAEFEASLGFRSSFNLIPEGDYDVPSELRRWLGENRFEVGVHDLHHDGKLYDSRESFRAKARRINAHLRDWSAAGFRSGFMLHRLDWIHDLDIAYDASTFDTDPFEPQPEPAGTVFPYWIADSARPGSGYWEFPYTLPQDSTLFLVLREADARIWIDKADWLAERRAMLLVNVHPDYVRFPGEPASPRTFPVEHYGALLRHLSGRHRGRYWQPLARELAGWLDSASPSARRAPTASPRPLSLRGKRAAVLLYGCLLSDFRVLRAAQAMVEQGMEVDVLCLTEFPQEAARETAHGIEIHRLAFAHRRGAGKLSYIGAYVRYFAAALRFLCRRRYDVVHVHNMPDFLAFAAGVQKLRGAKVLLDLHDPMPELMMSIYGLSGSDWSVRMLRAVERASVRFADAVLTPNLTFRNLFVSRGCPPEKLSIVMNSPDEAEFNPVRFGVNGHAPRGAGGYRVMHHGAIVHRHGLDLLIEAAARARGRIPDLHVDIYGTRTPFLEVVMRRAEELGIGDIVHYHGPRNTAAITRAILESDVGVIPNRRCAFTEMNFPTRIFEFLAMGRPVIAPDTRGIRDYFQPDELPFFEQDNVDDLAARLLWMREQPGAAERTLRRSLEVYHRHLWSVEKGRLVNVVERLVAAS